MQTMTIKQERTELVRQINDRLQWEPDPGQARATFRIGTFSVSCTNDPESMQALAARLTNPPRLKTVPALPRLEPISRFTASTVRALLGRYIDDPDTLQELARLTDTPLCNVVGKIIGAAQWPCDVLSDKYAITREPVNGKPGTRHAITHRPTGHAVTNLKDKKACLAFWDAIKDMPIIQDMPDNLAETKIFIAQHPGRKAYEALRREHHS